MATRNRKNTSPRVRYAVVGLGHIAQAAVLPAFKHAKRAELAALVSDDPRKLKELGKKHKVRTLTDYEGYDDLLASGEIDAVYIALPNHMHEDYTTRAAQNGVHVLCEKPMAVTVPECRRMIAACNDARVKLMIAYRLHFERSNMDAVAIAESGRIGEVRAFSSLFSMNVKDEGNIRLQSDKGGGQLYDIGVYCINAARYLFRAEPTEVMALSASTDDPRFSEVDEMTGALLRFPGERLATFLTSFNAGANATFDLAGTGGILRLENAYEYTEKRVLTVTTEHGKKKKTYPKQDQFAPELEYFADCVLEDREPEPSGTEGMIDVAIVEALLESAQRHRPIPIKLPKKGDRPAANMVKQKRGVREPKVVNARPAH